MTGDPVTAFFGVVLWLWAVAMIVLVVLDDLGVYDAFTVSL